jgi:glycosyltransferase involved in cell wall biosynthesis
MHEAGDLVAEGAGAATTPGAGPSAERSICVLALSRVADDPRVRRHCDAFHRAGWNVIAVGLPGADSPAPGWSIVTAESAPAVSEPQGSGDAAQQISAPRRSKARAIAGGLLRRFAAMAITRRLIRGAIARLSILRYRLRQLGVGIRPRLAQDIYWSYSSNIQDIYACAGRVQAAVWLANDWTTLPIAARLAQERGGVYGYDTHEFAIEEYGHILKWRLLHRPMVRALERAFIGSAAVVSSVSPGISQRLREIHGLAGPVLTVRNTPAFVEARFRPTGDQVRVLYHGIITPNRGLEAAIDSVPDWRSEFSLTIRGPAEQHYEAALRQRIEQRGMAARISLVPPVPMTELVQEAASFDIGLFALPGNSRHNEFALPNKFFEYVMAGLALCVTDLPEMQRLMRQYELGITISQVTPAAIAKAVNRFDRELIDACKRRSLAAARELCWERESERLINAYETAVEWRTASA